MIQFTNEELGNILVLINRASVKGTEVETTAAIKSKIAKELSTAQATITPVTGTPTPANAV